MGAFISEYRPAVIDDSRDEIQPPSAKLTFNPSIKNNDGLLVNFITQTTQCSHFEALQIIEKERDDILYHLDKGRKVKLEGLGTFSYNKENKVDFTAEENKNLLPDSFGLETVSFSEKEEPQPVKEEEEESKPVALKAIPTVEGEEATTTEIADIQEDILHKKISSPSEQEEKSSMHSEELSEIGKYIRQLLQKNNGVIVPGFGAFKSEYQGNRKNISFSPYIKNNDGQLVGHIAEILECYNFEALQKIVKERDKIWKHLHNGEKVEMKGLGIFSLNEQKQIEFKPEQNLQETETENAPLAEKKAPILASEKPEKMLHEEKEKTGTTTEEQQKTTGSIPDLPANEKEKEPPFVVVLVNEPTEKGTKGGQNKKEEAPQKEIIKDEKPEKEKTTVLSTPDEIPDDKENRKKKAWLWILLIILLLILAGTFLFLRGNKNATEIPSQTTPNELQPTKAQTNIAPEPVNDSLPKETSTPVATDSQTVKETVQAEDNEPEEDCSAKYYLVSGSFKEKENATKYIKSLEEKGKQAFFLGKYGNFYIVGIGAYQSQREAMDAKWDYLVKHMDSGVWILKR